MEQNRFKIAIRIRPSKLLENEQNYPAEYVETVAFQKNSNSITLLKPTSDNKTYQYDTVFPENSSQFDVFEALGKPIIDQVLQGYNGTIISYGQVYF